MFYYLNSMKGTAKLKISAVVEYEIGDTPAVIANLAIGTVTTSPATKLIVKDQVPPAEDTAFSSSATRSLTASAKMSEPVTAKSGFIGGVIIPRVTRLDSASSNSKFLSGTYAQKAKVTVMPQSATTKCSFVAGKHTKLAIEKCGDTSTANCGAICGSLNTVVRNIYYE